MIYINGQKVVTDIKVNDGLWHFVCITWESGSGSWNVFVDGHLRDNGTRLARGFSIQGDKYFAWVNLQYLKIFDFAERGKAE